MSFQEVLQVKDDILKNNRELEEKIKSHIDVYGNKFKMDINSFSDRIQKVTDSNEKFMKTLPNINYKLSKIDQIEKFNVRTDHKLTSFEVRISAILEQIEKIKTKYDKIILDNLFVSGHIGGAHCQYENLSEYLVVNINDVNLLKLEKDQMKKDIKAIKGKQDSIVKQTVNLIDASVNRCNLYTDNKKKDFELLLETKTREFNEKIMEIRMNVCKIQMQTEEAVNNLTIGFDKMKQENNFFMKGIMEQFNEMKNEVSEFINEYKSRINNLYKENNSMKKETNNIKENIEHILEILEYQNSQNMNIQEIQKNFLDSMEDLPKKRQNLKGSYFPSLGNLNSQIKKKLKILSPSPRKTKGKLLNSINGTQRKMSPIKRNTRRRRNTIAYTEPIFNKNIINKFKERSKVKSPKFLGTVTPILKNIINFKDDEKSERFSFSKKNGDKFDLNSTIKSIKIEKEKEKKINNSKSKHSESSKSSKNSNSDSKTDSESNSLSISMTSSNEEKKEANDKITNLQIRRRSSSKRNFTKLSLKKKTKIDNNAMNYINIINNDQKNNKKGRRRASVGLLGSINIMYKNNDISEILTKKFSKKQDFNNNNKFIIEDSKNNYIINKNDEKISPNEHENIMKDNENNLKNNNPKSKFNFGNSKNIKIFNNNNLVNAINLKRGSASNERYNSNTLEVYLPFSKNHKRNYIISPSKEDQGIGYKIVSFDIPENVNLPQRTTQVYSLNGRKLRKKPQIKTDFVSPLDELYKQQYKKKMSDLKISGNGNSNMMVVNNANDMPKKLLPLFGRTAYTFYGSGDKEGGINLANSLEVNNKNKNNLHNYQATTRNFNANSLQMKNINAPFNMKSFPKLKQKFNTEKNV